MAITKDSVVTEQIQCSSCGQRLRYNPKTDPKLPPRERSNIPEDVPAEAALFREIACPVCAAAIAVPIPDGDVHLGKWLEVKENFVAPSPDQPLPPVPDPNAEPVVPVELVPGIYEPVDSEKPLVRLGDLEEVSE